MGKASREKGKRGEIELGHALEKLGFSGARRGRQFSGLEGQDVVGIEGVHIECKRVEKLRLWESIDQAVTDAKASGRVPAVVHRRNQREWVVIIRLSDCQVFATRFLRALGFSV